MSSEGACRQGHLDYIHQSTSKPPFSVGRLYPQGQLDRELSCRPSTSSWPNMAVRPRRTERCKALRLVCWNVEGVRSRKLELEHFLKQHGVDMSLN